MSFGAQAVFLGAGDEPRAVCLAGKRSSSTFIAFISALDRRQLVLRVEDLEALRQAGELPVRAQEAVAQAVEGADPHAAHVDRQHRAEPRQHLLGRLVGEGHGQHAARRDLAGLDQPGDAGRQHARLARAGAGQDQRVLGRQRDGGELLGVEVSSSRESAAAARSVSMRRL